MKKAPTVRCFLEGVAHGAVCERKLLAAALGATDVRHDAVVGQGAVPHAGFALGFEPSHELAFAVFAKAHQTHQNRCPQNDPSAQFLAFG